MYLYYNMNFTPNNSLKLRNAILEYNDNKSDAIDKYGDINNWDVSFIEDFAFIFLNCKTFNDYIGNCKCCGRNYFSKVL